MGAFQWPQAHREGATGLATLGLWDRLNWLNWDPDIMFQGCSVSERVNRTPSWGWAGSEAAPRLWGGLWTRVAFFPLLCGRSS